MFKQKADRNKVVAPPPPPVLHTEIVPGRLTEQNWQDLEETLDNEETACEYVDEILKELLVKSFDVYLQRQLLPYTVSAAKDALLLVVEWNFLHRDESQISPVLQPGWTPDKEPIRPLIDNWAPGYFISPDEKPEEEIVEEPSVMKLDEEPELINLSSTSRETPLDQSQCIASSPQISQVAQLVDEPLLSQEICLPLGSENTDPKVKIKENKSKKLQKSNKAKLSKARQKQSHYELLQKASCSRMSETLSQAEREEQQKIKEALQELEDPLHDKARVRDGRNAGNRDVFYDPEGRIIGVIKINPDKLPSNRVKIEYQLPEREDFSNKMDKKRNRYKDKSMRNSSSSTYQRPPIGRSIKKNFGMDQEELSNIPMKSMLEAIDPVVGVTVRDTGQIKVGPNKGPVRQLLTAYADELRPITRRVPIPTTDLLEILQPTTTLISHNSLSPLPPIHQEPQTSERTGGIRMS